MEDVLEVYQRPYRSERPVVCLDETFIQLIGEVREPLPAEPGRLARYDSVYVRNGVASVFLAFEPLAGPVRTLPRLCEPCWRDAIGRQIKSCW